MTEKFFTLENTDNVAMLVSYPYTLEGSTSFTKEAEKLGGKHVAQAYRKVIKAILRGEIK